MKKVTTINLNGTAYQVEEDGFEALSTYLKQASAKLEGNPDKDEIMHDFEQAVAEKFQAFLSASKNVVTASEVDAVLTAMGPVEGDSSESSKEDSTHEKTSSKPRRLLRIHEGSFLLGVCTGIAAYLDVDVTLVRLVFIILAILTSGGALFAYFLAAVFMPQARTVAEAHTGTARPFVASEFIQQAQQDYSQFRSKREWKQWKRSMKYGMPTPHAGHPTGGYYMFPFINLLRVILTLAFLAAIVSLISHHSLLGLALPLGIPLWLALIVVFAAWRMLSFPLRWVKYQTYAAQMPSVAAYYSGPNMFWHTISSIIWAAFVVLCSWLAYLYIPFVHELFTAISAHLSTQISQ